MPLIPEFQEVIEKLPGMLDELMACPMRPANPRSNFPNIPGVYALFEQERSLYVGRAKNLRQRIGNHIGGRPEQSSFAFKLARETTGRFATYTPAGSRKALMADEQFKRAFSDAVSRIRNLSVRFLEIHDDVSQHVFELYLALALHTPYNEFKTS